MDSIPLVDYRIDNGQVLVDRLEAAGVEVLAACWLKRSDLDRWSLYIATPLVIDGSTSDAYRRLRPVLLSLGDEWITSSYVTMVGATHPLVKDALDILRRFPHHAPIQSPRSPLGGIPVEEVFVYPLGKTTVPLYHLVYPNEAETLGIVSLDPSLLRGRFWTAVEHQGKRREYEAKTGIHCQVLAPESAKLEQDGAQMVLAWNDLYGQRHRSSANEVLSMANLCWRGFRLKSEPSDVPTHTDGNVQGKTEVTAALQGVTE